MGDIAGMGAMGQLPAMFGEDLFPTDLGGPNAEATFGTDMLLYLHPDNRDDIGDPLAPWDVDEHAAAHQDGTMEEDEFKQIEDSDTEEATTAAAAAAAAAAGAGAGAGGDFPTVTAADLAEVGGPAAIAEGDAYVDAAASQAIQTWISKHPCTCGEDCIAKFPNALEVAAGFNALSQADRRMVISHILTATTAPPGSSSGISTGAGSAVGGVVGDLGAGARPRKKARSETELEDVGGGPTGGVAGVSVVPMVGGGPVVGVLGAGGAPGASAVVGGASVGVIGSSTLVGGGSASGGPRAVPSYMLHGRRVCKTAFQALTMSGEKIIKTSLGMVGKLALQETEHNRGRHRKGVPHLRTLSAINFIKRIAELEGYPCPIFRGSPSERAVIFLPPELSKMNVYRLYVQACSTGIAADPQSALKTTGFLGAWQEKLQHIRVKKSAIDLCDICTRLSAFGDDAAQSLHAHRDRASKERNSYTNNIINSRQPGSGVQHITIDFGEKIHLPVADANTAAVQFVTGLRMDMLGVSFDTVGLHHTFCLPEGHWPMQKNANTFISMLHHVFESALTQAPFQDPQLSTRRVVLALDNSVSQSKNRWVVWYCAWRVLMGLQDEIAITYMVTGHAKHFVDMNMAKIKQTIREKKPRTPAQASQAIRDSFKNSRTVAPQDVRFFKWMGFLQLFFDKLIPNIARQHSLHFSAATPGIVTYKTYSDEPEAQLYLLKQGVRADDVQHDSAKLLDMSDPVVPLSQDRRAYLEEEVTNIFFKDDPHLIPQFYQAP